MIDSGSCDSNGYKMVGSKIECDQAATDLSLKDHSAYVTQIGRYHRPHGCIYANNNWLQWYSPGASYPSASCGSHDGSALNSSFNCICLIGKYLYYHRFLDYP